MQNKIVKYGVLALAAVMCFNSSITVWASENIPKKSMETEHQMPESEECAMDKEEQFVELEELTSELEKPTPEPEKPTPEPEKPTPEPEKPTPEPEKPTPEPEKPTPEPEKPTPEPEKPTPEPGKPTPDSEPNGGVGGVSVGGGAANGGQGGTGNGGNSRTALKHAVEKAEDLVKKKERELESLKEILKDQTLHAKISGLVTKVNLENGDEIIPGKPVVVIGEEEKKKVSVKIEENQINKVTEGQIVELNFTAFPNEMVNGKVVEKKYMASKDEGTGGVVFEVEIEVEDTEMELLDGMTCMVSFIEKRVEDVLTLSNKVIQIEDGQQFVYLKEKDGQIKKQKITGGFSDGRNTEIVEGLKVGDIAVIEG